MFRKKIQCLFVQSLIKGKNVSGQSGRVGFKSTIRRGGWIVMGEC